MQPSNKFNVYHNGKVLYRLNERLAEKQGITDQELINLVELHQQKLHVFDTMNATDDPIKLKQLAKLVEDFEFEMQKNWHFEQNVNMHEWYRVPKCICPKMDNEDRRGTEYRIYNATCPIHGQ